MWQKNSKLPHRFLLLAGLLVNLTSQAAGSGTTTLQPIQLQPSAQLQPQYQIRSDVLAVAAPIITGVSQSVCTRPGDSVEIIGNHFPPQGTAGVALGGNSQHLHAVIKSWSTTTIGILLPKSGLQAGKHYYVGLEKLDHSRWLSNISQSVKICAAPAGTLSKSARFQGGTQLHKRLGGSGFAVEEPGNDTLASPTDTGESSTADVPLSNSHSRFRSSGGTLISGGLPPPPQAPVMEEGVQEEGIEPGELLILSADMDEALQVAQQLAGSGVRPIRRQHLASLGLVISVFRLSPDMKVGQQLQQIRETLPTLWSEANHRYQLLGSAASSDRYAHEQIAWRTEPGCGKALRLGMIDAAIAPDHPALIGQSVIRRSFLSSGIAPAPAEHGTSIAIQLIGAKNSSYPGLLPEATLYAAEVFRDRKNKRTETTAEWVIRALDWLVQEQVQVINISLGGPRNILLEKVLERVMQVGVSVVAAAGNQGGNAPPVYPAAQAGVVAVTAVDQAQRLYSQANQGDYVDFAAPGVDLRLARLDGTPVYRSGTSFATPYVTALLAYLQKSSEAPEGGLAAIKRLAIDLGRPGKDPLFGWGLIQAASACSGQ